MGGCLAAGRPTEPDCGRYVGCRDEPYVGSHAYDGTPITQSRGPKEGRCGGRGREGRHGTLSGLPQRDRRRISNLSPRVPQPQYHFTKYEYGLQARSHFDPRKPTSLLYAKTADGYKLIGAMYTDRVDATEEEINERIPLSIARWHQHVNFCKAPVGQKAAYFGPDAKFGLRGSIITRDACEAAGGEFYPHLFGWMVHVYPYETDPKRVWSTNDDDEGHDNMDRSAMPGMKMN